MAPRKAKDCSNMEEVRAEIDRIDQALVDLIGERFSLWIAPGNSSSRRLRRACRGASSK